MLNCKECGKSIQDEMEAVICLCESIHCEECADQLNVCNICGIKMCYECEDICPECGEWVCDDCCGECCVDVEDTSDADECVNCQYCEEDCPECGECCDEE